MKKIILFILVIVLLTIISGYILGLKIAKKENNLSKLEIGILKGKVILRTGDCMPLACGPEGCPPSSCYTEGIRRNITIRELSKYDPYNHTVAYGSLIKVIESNDTGEFITTLSVGNYSIFVIENSEEYCNLLRELNNAFISCLIQIKKNETTNFDLVINYATD